MKNLSRVMLALGCLALILLSWMAALGAQSDLDKQLACMSQAEALVQNKIYIRAAPLLEEAASYRTDATWEAEEALKRVYLSLGESEFLRKYRDLLARQMGREDASPDVYLEAARFYLQDDLSEALAVLRAGIAKTGDGRLEELYEQERYAYTLSGDIFDEAAEISGGTVQVMRDGKWGLALGSGELVIPCVYDKVSTFDQDRAVVEKGGEIYAVDSGNHRLAVPEGKTDGFSNYAQNRLSLCVDGKWYRADGELRRGQTDYEAIGMYRNGRACAKMNGKWGVMDLDGQWIVEPQYEEIIKDELGRCGSGEAVFVRENGQARLLTPEGMTVDAYEDARPFADGLAAVKKQGKWGFIDETGAEKIPFQFEDALSFGQHLAAVKTAQGWGYINAAGKMVIGPVFLQAKSFSGGHAPVRDEAGWRLLTLREFEEEAGL